MVFFNTGLFVHFFKENYEQKSVTFINFFRIPITFYGLIFKLSCPEIPISHIIYVLNQLFIV